ncbi:MAG: hypothetical protein E6J17_10145 [Chloroflexi bacterium]|nr:MAG: hypothetical protein E6J17_10145 [Chloroflexota bacterium]
MKLPASGEAIDGIGVLDLETRAGTQRFMQHAACEVTIDGATDVVVGFENHSGKTTLGPAVRPTGRRPWSMSRRDRGGSQSTR